MLLDILLGCIHGSGLVAEDSDKSKIPRCGFWTLWSMDPDIRSTASDSAQASSCRNNQISDASQGQAVKGNKYGNMPISSKSNCIHPSSGSLPQLERKFLPLNCQLLHLQGNSPSGRSQTCFHGLPWLSVPFGWAFGLLSLVQSRHLGESDHRWGEAAPSSNQDTADSSACDHANTKMDI